MSAGGGAPADCSPASVLTSIGKNVISATTAAFDCQSKPNHMTKIGAMPTSGTVLASVGVAPDTVRRPKSTVQKWPYVPMLRYPAPSSVHVVHNMIALCAGLFHHASTAAAGDTSPQATISPYGWP